MEALSWVREGETDLLEKWLNSVDVKENPDVRDALSFRPTRPPSPPCPGPWEDFP